MYIYHIKYVDRGKTFGLDTRKNIQWVVIICLVHKTEESPNVKGVQMY